MGALKILQQHPLPWTAVDPNPDYLYNPDMGGIKDANGEWVVWLGDAEQYYPTSGHATDGVLELLVTLLNEDANA